MLLPGLLFSSVAAAVAWGDGDGGGVFEAQAQLGFDGGLRADTLGSFCQCSVNLKYRLSAVVRLGEDSYWVPPKAVVTQFCHPVFTPTTVISVTQADLPITGAWLEEKVTRFLETDDVFSAGFLASLVFLVGGGADTVQEEGNYVGGLGRDTGEFARKWGVGEWFIADDAGGLREGPYFLGCDGLKEAWRVYEDTLDAFQVGAVPSMEDQNTFSPLPISISSSTHISIAVPSRLYSAAPSAQKPLSGLRIGIKDIIDVAGLPTSYQSRAYLALHPQALSTTASAVQALIDKGAVIVGKTRTTQFAAGEQASGDWVDFLPPWNPRGDGWQVPGMSSAGSASAVAGYGWIDAAVGSDTLGSMTGPAALQGVFGNRISTGTLQLDGVMPITSLLDTLGVFTRSISVFNTIMSAWLPPASVSSHLPKALIYPTDYFPLSPPEVQAPISAFVEKLEQFLQVQKREVSFAEEWKKTATFDEDGVGITEYLKTVVSTLQLRGSWEESRAWVEEYRSVFGREMEVHAQVAHKWKLGARITDEQKAAAELKKHQYAHWLTEHFFQAGCESALLLVPVFEVGKVMYRNEYRGPPEDVNYIGMGWYEGLEPVLAGLPVVVVPVGQFPYHSRMSGRTEWLPVGVAVVAARNCDLMLAQLLERVLGEVGMGVVDTGKFAFAFGVEV